MRYKNVLNLKIYPKVLKLKNEPYFSRVSTDLPYRIYPKKNIKEYKRGYINIIPNICGHS